MALASLVATPRILVHLIRVDKSFKAFQLVARSLARLGISELSGDYCVGSQLGLDLISSFRILREAGCLSLFCVTESCSEVCSLGADTRLG